MANRKKKSKKSNKSKRSIPAKYLGWGIVLLLVGVWAATAVYRNSRSTNRPGGSEARPLVYSADSPTTLLNRMSAEETGLNFVNQLSPENQLEYTYNGAGVVVGDYDNDGLPDIFLLNEEGPSRLYRNLGKLRFEDVTTEAKLTNTTDAGGFSVGGHFADVDNDDDLDLFVTNWQVPNRLFRNEGDGTFTDMTEAAGVGYAGGATTATFADYDRDGDLDFFVATYRPHPIEAEQDNLNLQMVNGQLVVPPDLQERLLIVTNADGQRQLRELGERDLLYRNRGDGTFDEVALAAGIGDGYWGLSAMFSDIDNDGWPDLYVTNDFWSPDRFYHNQGNGTFALVDPSMMQSTPWSSMGLDFADINNDGFVDYFVGDMISRDHTKRMTQHAGMDMSPPPPGNAPQVMHNGLYLNNGDGSFSNIAWLADVAATEWTWTTKFADLDLDGFVDLLITNGMLRDWMDSDAAMQAEAIQATQGQEAAYSAVDLFPPLANADLLFRNKGDLTFEEVSEAWGFNTASVGNGAAMADFDADGDLDVVVNYLNEPVGFFRNDAIHPRISVSLRGRDSNRWGLGARVTLTTDKGVQTRYMTTSGGYLSGHEPLIVFGLGDSQVMESLEIEWPSGHIQQLPDDESGPLKANNAYTVVEPQGDVAPPPARPIAPRPPQFEEVALSVGLTQAHVENNFDDFAVQPLLPRRVSTIGPGVAWGDMDDDGDDDLYISGATGRKGSLYQNNGNGSFTDITGQTAVGYAISEELAPLWWHDGQEQNLLLSYSTVENPNSPLGGQAQRITASPVNFAPGAWSDISESSSGALAAADFDGDGDLDLFVGGRVVPGQWPLPASSRFYLNDNGRLTDATATLAPDLINLGMATGALWSDIDNDGDSDLVIATEFGPVHLLINDNGRLAKATQQAGLADWTGLWTGITAADFDGDGDMDLAAANLGLNTKYTASPTHPAVVYGGNIDGDGDVDIVEAYYVEDTLYPIRYRGMAGEDMPFILEKFATFKAYAEATLNDIYGDRLNNAHQLTATTLAHTLFINDGGGRFIPQSLPQLAQVTAGYGLTVADFDNDGYDDLYLVGNFHHADHETMLYTGGVSYWLRGQGDGSFVVVPSSESGLMVPYDARGVAVSDYDGDGWVDVAVGLNNNRPLLFHNRATGHYALTVRLVGPPANPTGVGARITVTHQDGHTAVREVRAGNGYFSQDSATMLFGLGTEEQAQQITVRWPDGRETTVNNILANEPVIISWEP